MSIEVQPPDTPVYSISGVLLDTFSHTSSFFNWHGWCHVSIIKGEQLFVFVKLGPSSRPFSVSLNWHFDYFSRRELYKMTFLCDFRAASTLYFFLHTDKRYLSDSVMRIFWFFMQFFLFGSKWKKEYMKSDIVFHWVGDIWKNSLQMSYQWRESNWNNLNDNLKLKVEMLYC